MEKLLIPRVKVTNHYPWSPFTVGDILQRIPQATEDWFCKGGKEFPSETRNPTIHLDQIRKSPANFRELEWWEEREYEEMPGYIRLVDEKIICKVLSILHDVGFTYAGSSEFGSSNKVFSNNTMPATEQEYNDFIKK